MALSASGCSGCHRDTPAPDHDCSVCSSLPNTQSSTCVPEVTCTSSACVSCESIACSLGFADCDGATENGCEVDLTNTAASCGRCHHACAGACTNGSCRATTSIASGLTSPAGIALAGDDVWWAATGSTADPSRGALQHAPKSGGAVVTVMSGATTGGVLAYPDAIAWSVPSLAADGGANGSIALAPLDGGPSQTIVSGHMPLGGLASDDVAITWLDTDGTNGELFTWTEDAGVSMLASMSRSTPLLRYPTSSIAVAGPSISWIEGDTTSRQSVLRAFSNADGGVRDAVPLATAVASDGAIVFAIVSTATGVRRTSKGVRQE
ncbi:MAG: hypothetical protein ACRELY_32640, partial [Polyangiaceae bacterium]